MKIEIIIKEEIETYLGNARDDLDDYIEIQGFKMLNPEIKKAIIAKLMMQ